MIEKWKTVGAASTGGRGRTVVDEDVDHIVVHAGRPLGPLPFR